MTLSFAVVSEGCLGIVPADRSFLAPRRRTRKRQRPTSAETRALKAHVRSEGFVRALQVTGRWSEATHHAVLHGEDVCCSDCMTVAAKHPTRFDQ